MLGRGHRHCHRMGTEILPIKIGMAVQNEEPGSRKNATSSAVDGRARMRLRCGKRPKRWMMC